jgi:hypothetical protein
MAGRRREGGRTMNRSTLFLPAIILLSAASAARAEDLPPSRAGLVLFKMPAGRQRVLEGDVTVLRATDPNAKTYEVRILPPGDSRGTAADALEAYAAPQNGSRLTPAGDMTAYRHPVTGYDVATRAYRMRDGRGDVIAIAYVFVLQSGARNNLIEVFAPEEVLRKENQAISDFVLGCRLAHVAALVPGNPPLTVYDLDEGLAFLEWILDVSFTDEQRGIFKFEIIDGWKKKDQETIESMQAIHMRRAELARLTPDQQDLVRKQIEGALVADLRKQKDDRCAKLLVSIYDASRKPLAAGPPALTRQQADSAIELFYFMAGQLESFDGKPTAEEKDQWAKRLTDDWPKIAPMLRQQVTMMPLAWAATRAGWYEMKDADREEIKKGFAQIAFVKEIRAVFAKAKANAQAAQAAEAGANPMAELTRLRSLNATSAAIMNTSYNSTMSLMASMRNMSGGSWQYRPR